MRVYSRVLLVFILNVSIITFVFSQNKSVTSKIEKVTVFQHGAQIYRKANTNVKVGHQIIRLSNLSNNIDVASIQVNGKGKFTIMSVTHQINYLKEITKNKRIKVLNDSIIMLNDEVAVRNQVIMAFNDEKQLLKANQSLKSQNTNLKASEIKLAADFFRSRFREIYSELGKLNKQIAKLQVEVAKVRKTLNQLQRYRAPKGVGEILVEVEAKLASSIKLEFDYLIYNAGWTPQYDIRAKDINSSIELHYRANIFQNSGVEWKKVKLTVSTGNPRNNSIMPVLSPWYLGFRTVGGGTLQNISLADEDMEVIATQRSVPPAPRAAKVATHYSNANNSSNYTTVSQGQTNTKFAISLPYTIPSTNKKVSVKVQKWNLNADYRYYCAPRISEDVYLQARITGWEELSLLPGVVNIFFDGTYVSKSQLNPMSISDTLDISLGIDKSIIVKRKKVKDSSSKSIIGSNKKMKVAWDIVVRNNKSQTVNLFLQDQIPLTYREDVEVKLNDKSGANYDSKRGFLSWNLEIKPHYKKELKYSYQIKYPKDLMVNSIW